VKKLCIYHRIDLDGQCSAAIVRRRFHDVELHGWNYGDQIPWEKIEDADEVILVDVSFPPVEMCRLPPGSVWIDHHKTAIESMGDAGKAISGTRRDGTAACELSWEYYFPDEPMPRAVWLIGRWDVWAWKGLPERNEIEAFQFGMQSVDTRPEQDIWRKLFTLPFKIFDIVETGKSILRYRDRNYSETAKLAFETFLSWQIGPDLHAAKFLALNAGGGSTVFDSVWADHPDCVAKLSFFWTGERWTVSLYSDRGFDCSTVAKAHAGGGHAGAAGFQCRELPFSLHAVTEEPKDLPGHEEGLPAPEAELELILKSQNALMEAQFDREIDASLPGKGEGR